MSRGNFGSYGTYKASEAITEGQGVLVSGLAGGGAVEMVDAADECNGVACQTCEANQWTMVCTFGECQLYTGDTTADKGAVKCHTDATFIAADANNIQAQLDEVGVSGELKWGFFIGPWKGLRPTT